MEDMISDQEITRCAQVLEYAGQHLQEYTKGPKFRAVRKAVAPLLDQLEKARYTGEERLQYKDKKRKQMEENRKQHQRKAHDRNNIQKCSLRSQRMAKLESLQLVGAPDGAADACIEAPPGAATEELHSPRSCYVCKIRFTELHFFYDQLCGKCAPLNYAKRLQTRDMAGRYALVTGARVKIGFQVTLKLLRAGAHVVATSRFPRDAAARFAAQDDFGDWGHRLRLYGLDFRDIATVESFCATLCRDLPRLDLIVNNACQTVRRPAAYYKTLVATELQPRICERGQVLDQLVDTRFNQARLAVAKVAGLDDEAADAQHFPEGAVDVNGQQLDLRTKNSWLLTLEEVSTAELAEVLAINSIAPFVLNSKLKGLMTGVKDQDKWIVNVSAMEGKFYRYKGAEHPHTNMAKAALNMMTRTSAQDYAKDRIYMTAVDTGWINDENPLDKAARIAATGNFQTPIDEVDAAARILDPVFGDARDSKGVPLHGVFLKDYHTSEW